MQEGGARRGLDIGIPVAIAVLGTVELIGLRPQGLGAAIALEWLACGLLVFRRRRPILACTLAGLVVLALPYVGPELNDPATPILVVGLAVFSLARYVANLRGLISVVLFPLMVLADIHFTRDYASDMTDLVFVGALMFPPYVYGRLMRLLADRNRLLAEHAALLAAKHESAQREAVAAERARMAREMHDVIAHGLSVMTVQAAAAEDLLRDNPQAAVTALREIQSTGRGALVETGRLLRLLRDTDDELGLAPERGVAELDSLVSEFRRGGLEVDLTVTGPLQHLPTGLAVSAYRVVREILTNALKYAADRRVILHVVHGSERLVVSAENRVAPDDGGGTTGGLGLVGMAERVGAHGGVLEHGRRGDRFVVAAWLPLSEPAS